MSNYEMPPPSEPNYPYGNEFARAPGIHFSAIVDAWTLLTRDLVTWLASMLIVGIIIGIVVLPLAFASLLYQYGTISFESLQHPPDFMKQVIGALIQQAGCIVSFPLTTGLSWMALKQLRGEEISVTTVFEIFRALPRLMAAGLVFGLLVGIGSMLLIVPGLYASAAFSFAGLMIMDQNLPSAESLVGSAKALGVQTWLLMLLMIVLSFIVLAGFCVFFVGALFTVPLYYIVIALHYNYFFPRRSGSEYVLPEYPQP